MADEMGPVEYAVKTNKLSCVKELLKQHKNKMRHQRAVRAPTCMMKSVGTGKYNYRSLGIKKIRRLNMSRGGREGNNALVKDSRLMRDVVTDLSEKMMEWNTPIGVVETVISNKGRYLCDVNKTFELLDLSSLHLLSAFRN